jgi:hypothetical protein
MDSTDAVIRAEAASPGGGLVINDSSAGLTPLDSSGNGTAAAGTANLDASPLDEGGDWVGALTSANDAIAEFAGPSVGFVESTWPVLEGDKQKQSSATFLSIRVSCSPPSPCPLKKGDRLMFSKDKDTCSEDLGLHYCPTSEHPGWYWSVEVRALGLDDAANWTIQQTKDSLHFKGMGKNGQGVLVPFDPGPVIFTAPNNDDGPQPSFLQQEAGQKQIFYIDAPGVHDFVRNIFNGVVTPGLLQVDSITMVQNFTAHLCRKNSPPSSCHLFPWFVKILVNPGASLNPQTSIDTVNSKARQGKRPIKF